MIILMDMVKCLCCKGKGYVIKTSPTGGTETTICTCCGGKGEVPKTEGL
jgi:hypothetical protein